MSFNENCENLAKICFRMKLTWALLRIQSQINLVPGKISCETFLITFVPSMVIFFSCYQLPYIHHSFTFSSLQGHFEMFFGWFYGKVNISSKDYLESRAFNNKEIIPDCCKSGFTVGLLSPQQWLVLHPPKSQIPNDCFKSGFTVGLSSPQQWLLPHPLEWPAACLWSGTPPPGKTNTFDYFSLNQNH